MAVKEAVQRHRNNSKEIVEMKCFLRFFRCDKGVAYIEFAISISVLLLVFIGAVEVSRYELIIQKMEKTVSTIADVVAQSVPSNGNGGTDAQTLLPIMNDVPNMMAPYGFSSNGRAIISDVSTNQNGGSSIPIVNWQYCGGGTLAVKSAIGSQGGNAIYPFSPNFLNYTFDTVNTDEVIIGEIYYNFTPIFPTSVLTAIQLSRSALYVPRFTNLSNPTDKKSYPATCP